MADEIFGLFIEGNSTVSLPKSEPRCAGALPKSVPQKNLPLLELYSNRRSDIIRYLFRFGVTPADAEDIVQEVFLKIINSDWERRAPDNLFNWILICARNLAIDRYRRFSREQLAPFAQWAKWEDSITDGSVSAEEYMRELDEERQLVKAMEGLDVVEQQCIILRSRGVTFREIAVALNVPLQSAVYTTGVAIQKIQRKIKCAHK